MSCCPSRQALRDGSPVAPRATRAPGGVVRRARTRARALVSVAIGRRSQSHPPESNRRPTDYESVALPTELGWRSLKGSLGSRSPLGGQVAASSPPRESGWKIPHQAARITTGRRPACSRPTTGPDRPRPAHTTSPRRIRAIPRDLWPSPRPPSSVRRAGSASCTRGGGELDPSAPASRAPSLGSRDSDSEISSRWKHLEAQPAAVRAHAVIGADDAKVRQRLSQEKGAGEVKRVQGSDGLHGKRSLRAFGHLSQ